MDTKTYFTQQVEIAKETRDNFKETIRGFRAEEKSLKAQLREAKANKDEKAYQEIEDELVKVELHIKEARKIIAKQQLRIEVCTQAARKEFVCMENGIVVEVSKLRAMHKKFRKYKLDYEYVQTDRGLEVNYTNVSVKGLLYLVPASVSIPPHVEVPLLKIGECLADA